MTSFTSLHRIQPTYEELKHQNRLCSVSAHLGIQPTYEELKRSFEDLIDGLEGRIQPTYEELKLLLQASLQLPFFVSSLPMRN